MFLVIYFDFIQKLRRALVLWGIRELRNILKVPAPSQRWREVFSAEKVRTGVCKGGAGVQTLRSKSLGDGFTKVLSVSRRFV